MDLKVDELLASIRKTMDSDIDALSTSMTTQSRGTLMRGALREMRVSMGVEQPEDMSAPLPRIRPTDEDLPTLRDRIRRNVEESEMLAAAQPAPPSPSQFARAQYQEPLHRPTRSDFSNILDVPPEAPNLRPSYDQDDEDLRYDQEQNWQQQAAYAQRYAEPPRLMAPHVEAATDRAFQQLSDNILHRALGDRSLEDMARDMLRGQIKQWVDANLPQLVEAIVREEIERVSRRGR